VFQKLMRERVHHAKSTIDTGRRKSRYGRKHHMPHAQEIVQDRAALPLVAQDINAIEGEALLCGWSMYLQMLEPCPCL
jgi:hypothetical protein